MHRVAHGDERLAVRRRRGVKHAYGRAFYINALFLLHFRNGLRRVHLLRHGGLHGVQDWRRLHDLRGALDDDIFAVYFQLRQLVLLDDLRQSRNVFNIHKRPSVESSGIYPGIPADTLRCRTLYFTTKPCELQYKRCGRQSRGKRTGRGQGQPFSLRSGRRQGRSPGPALCS